MLVLLTHRVRGSCRFLDRIAHAVVDTWKRCVRIDQYFVDTANDCFWPIAIFRKERQQLPPRTSALDAGRGRTKPARINSKDAFADRAPYQSCSSSAT